MLAALLPLLLVNVHLGLVGLERKLDAVARRVRAVGEDRGRRLADHLAGRGVLGKGGFADELLHARLHGRRDDLRRQTADAHARQGRRRRVEL